MITYTNAQDEINIKLASGTNIPAFKHRETMQTLLDYIQQYVPLHIGSFHIGNLSSTDMIFTITIPNVGTNNYYVIGSLRSDGASYNNDNDVFWVWREATSTSFKLALRELAAETQNLTFFYEIKKIIV